ncbi:MAG: hypothetical protein HKN08_05325 [Gammaproteobacteria bacterium]|nr:hypothetical protein [Gammaproteobacteria bacterium]
MVQNIPLRNNLDGGLSLDSNKLTIWRYTDGRPGHDSQSQGLSSALCRHAACELFDIKTPSTLFTLACLLRGRPAVDFMLPHPALIIGAGRRTHLPVLASKKAVGGKSLILMRPTFPYSFYDYCLVPDHDTPPVLNNVISTTGALNTIIATPEKDPQLGVIMIGGPSRYFNWQDDIIISVIETIIHRGLAKWAVFDSPRTPNTTRIRIKDIKAAGFNFFPYQNNSREALAAKLVKAANVWVTADSVSMLYESLTAGAPTGVIPVPNKKPNKISSSLEILNYEGQCTSYEEWYDGRSLTAPRKQLNEADRCAEIIINGLTRSV